MVTIVDVTTFYFEIPKLIQKINTKVEYSIRNRTEKPKGFGDNSIIDAEMLIGEYIAQIAYDLWNKLISPFGRTLADLETPLLPFEYNVDFTPAGIVSAGSFVVGTGYTILVPGTTDFTLIGAADSEIGTSFVATGTGTGTGTANYSEIEECILYRAIWPTRLDTTVTPAIYVASKTFDQSVIPAITKAIEEVIVSFAVWNWMMDSNIQGWEKYEYQHNDKYDNLRGLTTRRVNLKRSYKLY